MKKKEEWISKDFSFLGGITCLVLALVYGAYELLLFGLDAVFPTKKVMFFTLIGMIGVMLEINEDWRITYNLSYTHKMKKGKRSW